MQTLALPVTPATEMMALLQDLQRAGVTDWVAETPTIWAQRHEQKLWLTGGSSDRVAQPPQQRLGATVQRAAAPLGHLTAATPASQTTVAGLPLLLTAASAGVARAVVVITEPDLQTPASDWPYSKKLVEMLGAIGLTLAQTHVLRVGGTVLAQAEVDWATVQQQVRACQLGQPWPPVLAFGQAAAQALKGEHCSLALLNAQWTDFGPCGAGVATYHPQLALEQPGIYRRKIWDALQVFRAKLTLQ